MKFDFCFVFVLLVFFGLLFVTLLFLFFFVSNNIDLFIIIQYTIISLNFKWPVVDCLYVERFTTIFKDK